MARAGYAIVITDSFGNRLAGASVEVRQPGTALPLGATLYAGLTGNVVLSNPLVANSQGFVAFFVDTAQVVDLYVTAAGYQAQTAAGVSVAVGAPLFDGMQVGGETDTNARVGVRRNSSGTGLLRRRVNLIEGTNVTIAVADDAANEEVDVTIAGLPAAVPAVTLGTVAAAGVAAAVLRADCTLAAFDATAPSTQAFGDAAATGSAAVAARRDHKHALPTDPVPAHNVAAGVHGLGASVNVLGNRSASGEFVQRGDTGAQTPTSGALSLFGSAGGTVTFPVAFSSAPRVFAGATNAAAVATLAAIYNVSTTGFTWSAYDFGTGTARTIQYLAIGS